jgi:hypothetical protein
VGAEPSDEEINLEVDMKMVKGLVMGSAAALLAAGSAQAADLPLKAKAVEYVKVICESTRLSTVASTMRRSGPVTAVRTSRAIASLTGSILVRAWH